MQFTYAVVGIRDDAAKLETSLRDFQKKHVFRVSIDGRLIKISEDIYDDEVSKAINRRSLTPSEIGCALGHLTAYNWANDTDWLIVLEDDVEVLGDISEIEEKLSRLSSEASVIHLDDFESMRTDDFFRYAKWKLPYRTHAYAINRTALDFIKQRQQNIISTADWPIQWAHHVKFFRMKNKVIRLKDLPSLIESDRLPYQNEAIMHFQIFRSSNWFFARYHNYQLVKYFIAFSYLFVRFKTYLMKLEQPLCEKIFTSACRAFTDLK